MVIQVFWDPTAIKGDSRNPGAYRALLKDRPRVYDCGMNPEEAVNEFLKTALSFGLSGEKKDYIIIRS